MFFVELYSCTNYNYLDELDDYVSDFKSSNLSTFPIVKGGERFRFDNKMKNEYEVKIGAQGLSLLR